MRSSEPMPGNPWPHEMAISIDQPGNLAYLLFVRAAWGLTIEEVPPLDAQPAVGTSARPSSIDPVEAEAEARWRIEWKRAWSRYVPGDRMPREPDDEIRRLLALPDEELFEAVSADPTAFWSDGIDTDAHRVWTGRRRVDHTVPVAQTPERRSLDALIPAWRRGLRTILELPYDGYFAERISPEYLVVSRITRLAPHLYSRALSTGIADRQ